MFDPAKKAFLTQVREKSADTHRSSGYSNWATSGVAWIILGASSGFSKRKIELKAQKKADLSCS
jgi:hypothetical protein